jgi:hypothetical protein
MWLEDKEIKDLDASSDYQELAFDVLFNQFIYIDINKMFINDLTSIAKEYIKSKPDGNAIIQTLQVAINKYVDSLLV